MLVIVLVVVTSMLVSSGHTGNTDQIFSTGTAFFFLLTTVK